MKQTQLIMGMPITLEIPGSSVIAHLDKAFRYFRQVDKKYSPYKKNSELTRINNGLKESQWTDEMREILRLCEETRRQTGGYFNIVHHGKLDPSGLVKGWAINNAATLIRDLGYEDFYIEAGGDIQTSGGNPGSKPWEIGIRNPFNISEIVKVISVSNKGVATSGTYVRGKHIYNPLASEEQNQSAKSLTVIGPNIYEADRFATAAFAMGTSGITFIDNLPGFEGYLIDDQGIATYTKGFDNYVVKTT